MIDKCPNAESDNDEDDDASRLIRDKCHGVNEPHTYHSDLPVHSLATNNTYANVFCSLCHGEATSDLAPFRVAVSCNNADLIKRCGLDVVADLMRDRDYVRGQLRWSRYMKARQFAAGCSGGASYPLTCQLAIVDDFFEEGVDSALPGARPCLNHRAVDSCHENGDGESKLSTNRRRKYESFCTIYGLVVVHDKKIYKNPHCAACNGIDLNSTRVATFQGKSLDS